MKTKPLFLSVCSLAVIALLAYWITGRDTTGSNPAASRASGDPLLDPALFQDVTEIRLTSHSGADETVLRKKGDSWILPDYFGLPADFDKLTRLTNNLLDARIERFVTAQPTSLERLNLGQASIRLLSGDGETWSLETGDSGQSGGRFVRIDGEEAAYLTRGSVTVDGNRENWPIKRPLEIEEREIARVEIEIDGETLAFSRAEAAAEFAGENFAENEKAKSREVSSLVRTLLNARFTQAVDPADPDARAAREHAVPITLEQFDGTRYTLEIGRRPGSGNEPEKPAEAATSSASIVIDQDGNIVSPEEIAQAEQEANAGRADPAPDAEPVEPGPVFIFYRSETPGFIWSELMENVALKFGDHLFNRLPENRADLIDITEPEPAEIAETPETPEAETAEPEPAESETENAETSGE